MAAALTIGITVALAKFILALPRKPARAASSGSGSLASTARTSTAASSRPGTVLGRAPEDMAHPTPLPPQHGRRASESFAKSLGAAASPWSKPGCAGPPARAFAAAASCLARHHRAVLPNPSLKRGPPTAGRLGREALTVYPAPRGQGTHPPGSA